MDATDMTLCPDYSPTLRTMPASTGRSCLLCFGHFGKMSRLMNSSGNKCMACRLGTLFW